jgi:hypothetical protein
MVCLPVFSETELILFCRNTVAQAPYGAYDVNASPSDYQISFPLYMKVEYNTASGDVYFSNRNSEFSIGRLFAANITIPLGSSLSQGNGYSCNN